MLSFDEAYIYLKARATFDEEVEDVLENLVAYAEEILERELADEGDGDLRQASKDTEIQTVDAPRSTGLPLDPGAGR